MGYSNPEFQSRSVLNVGRVSGTATASGANTLTDSLAGVAPPKFPRKTKINSMRLVNSIATPANWTGLTLIVKNGTATCGTGTASGTAGQAFDITMTGSLSTFTADSSPTFVFSGTSTASGQSLGTSNIFAEVQELFS